MHFESATIVPDPSVPFAINAADALPGWTVVAGGVGNGDIIYNTIPAGAAEVTLPGPGSFEPILQGSYSVILFGSSGGPTGSPPSGKWGKFHRVPNRCCSMERKM
jgi:hypothetical protein